MAHHRAGPVDRPQPRAHFPAAVLARWVRPRPRRLEWLERRVGRRGGGGRLRRVRWRRWILRRRSGRTLLTMAKTVPIERFASEVARALGERLVALLLYGSWARGTHVPDRSDVNTLLICDAVDDALFAALAPAMRDWTRADQPAPLILTEREWREGAGALPPALEGKGGRAPPAPRARARG